MAKPESSKGAEDICREVITTEFKLSKCGGPHLNMGWEEASQWIRCTSEREVYCTWRGRLSRMRQWWSEMKVFMPFRTVFSLRIG